MIDCIGWPCPHTQHSSRPDGDGPKSCALGTAKSEACEIISLGRLGWFLHSQWRWPGSTVVMKAINTNHEAVLKKADGLSCRNHDQDEVERGLGGGLERRSRRGSLVFRFEER